MAAFTLCGSRPSVNPVLQYCASVFYPRQAEFLNSKLQGSGMPGTHAGSLRGGLTMLGVLQICPRRTVAPQHRGMEFGVKCSKKLVSRLAALSRCLCAYADGQGRVVKNPTRAFVPRDEMSPLPDVLQDWGKSHSLFSKQSSDHTIFSPGYLPSYSTGALITLRDTHQPHSRLLKLQSLSSAYCKNSQ